MGWLDIPKQATAALGAAEISNIVQREIEARAFPSSRPGVPRGDGECQCPACCAERGEIPRELMETVDQFGPEAVAQALAEMLGIGGKKKRGRRRPSLDDIDFPF